MWLVMQPAQDVCGARYQRMTKPPAGEKKTSSGVSRREINRLSSDKIQFNNSALFPSSVPLLPQLTLFFSLGTIPSLTDAFAIPDSNCVFQLAYIITARRGNKTAARAREPECLPQTGQDNLTNCHPRHVSEADGTVLSSPGLGSVRVSRGFYSVRAGNSPRGTEQVKAGERRRGRG